MMKEDRYVRHLGYALRKLWLKNYFDKHLAHVGFHFTPVARSVTVNKPLGIFSGFRIRTQVVTIRDELGVFIVEQKYLVGNNEPAVVSFVAFKLEDDRAHLRLPDYEPPVLGKIVASAVTRRLRTKKRKKVGTPFMHRVVALECLGPCYLLMLCRPDLGAVGVCLRTLPRGCDVLGCLFRTR